MGRTEEETWRNLDIHVDSCNESCNMYRQETFTDLCSSCRSSSCCTEWGHSLYLNWRRSVGRPRPPYPRSYPPNSGSCIMEGRPMRLFLSGEEGGSGSDGCSLEPTLGSSGSGGREGAYLCVGV